MHHRHRLTIGLAGIVLFACAPGNVPNASRKTVGASAPVATASSTPTPGKTPAQSAQSQTYTGKVLGLDGLPAASVNVRAYLLAENSTGVMSNNGSSLVANNGGAYRLLADELATTTDANGNFTLNLPVGKTYNVEGVKDDTTKAMQQGVSGGTTGITLQLALTGAISGHVSAPKAIGVSDFEGVQVFIPGTSYSAITAHDGSYTISNVPVGSFTVVASKPTLGRAEASHVKVASKETVAADLALSLTAPALTAVTPAFAAAGAEITLTGDNFGASTGDALDVSIAGLSCSVTQRLDNHTIKVQVPPTLNASGDIIVKVAGIPSNSKAFTTITLLNLPPHHHDIAVGTQQKIHVVGYDADGKTFLDPPGRWTIDNANASVDESGIITAKQAGTVNLTFSAGAKKASAVLTLQTDNFLTTVAGDGTGVAGDVDGILSRFNEPGGLSTSSDGSIFVSDLSNQAIRKVAPDGTVSTFAGTLGKPQAGVPTPFPYSDNMDQAPSPSPVPSGLLDGAAQQALFNNPSAITADGSGNVYVLDSGNSCVRKITPTGQVSSLSQYSNSTVFKTSGNITDPDFGLANPIGLAAGGGSLYVAVGGLGAHPSALYKIESDGRYHAFATGQGSLAYQLQGLISPRPTPIPTPTPTPFDPLQFGRPQSVAVGANGTVYVSEFNSVVSFTPPNYQPRQVAKSIANLSMAVDPAGILYWVGNNVLHRLTPTGTLTNYTFDTNGNTPSDGILSFDAGLTPSAPHGTVGNLSAVAIGANGEIYLSDNWFHCIRQLYLLNP